MSLDYGTTLCMMVGVCTEAVDQDMRHLPCRVAPVMKALKVLIGHCFHPYNDVELQ